jgi:hypothetical protein
VQGKDGIPMPAETHQLREPVERAAVVEYLAVVVGVEVAGAADVELVRLGLDDDLAILDLWTCAVEEFGERCVGALELDDRRPRTLGELADLFGEAVG